MMVSLMHRRLTGLGIAIALCVPATYAQGDPHALLDRILDTYVRDGYVYYDALKKERANLDRYIASIGGAEALPPQSNPADQKAFWINAYNALVLRTVINAYPIKGKAEAYPPSSIGQVPGAFQATKHRVAGRMLTLDEIEKSVIVAFGDGRMLLALGRGTVDSPRLRSEAYRGTKLDAQLDQAVKEFVVRASTLKIDQAANVVEVSPLFSWREAEFVAAYDKGGEMWANRSPLERALMTMSYPHLFPTERDYLAKNTFVMKFGAYDWQLNDLTGRGGR